MKQHRVAVIGLGIMGRRMLANLAGHSRFAFAGGWDPAEESRRQAAAEVPGLPLADDAQGLIAAAETDLVYIACPPAFHAGYARAAAAAGKAVFCEKPLGVELADSRELVGELESAGVANAVNFAQASSRAVRLTEERLRGGELGRIAGADVVVRFARWPRDWQREADWLRFRAQGGFTREVLSHFLYLVERFLGPARLIGALPRYPDEPELCESHIVARLDCAGVPVQVMGSSGGSGPDRVELVLWGSRRCHRLHDWFFLQSAEAGQWVQEFPQVEDPRAEAFGLQLDNLAAFLDGEPHSLPSARTALSVQALVEAMLAGGA